MTTLTSEAENSRFLDRIDTPLGSLAIVTDNRGVLQAVGFVDGHERMDRFLGAFAHSNASAETNVRLCEGSLPGSAKAALVRYFEGDVTAIDTLEVAETGTPFQRLVWRTLRTIPCGETWSYGRLAKAIGNPNAVRAVGLANGQNPVGVVVPCHRVIGADGSLTGYGGGIERKRWLLAHEGHEKFAEKALSLPGFA